MQGRSRSGRHWAPVLMERAPNWRDTPWAMSREDGEVLRRFTDAFNARDLSTFLGCCDPDVEIDGGRILIGAPRYRGRAGVERLVRDMDTAWDELHAEIRDVVELGHGELVVVGEASGRGGTTGAPFAQSGVAAKIKLRGGKVLRCEFFAGELEAREAGTLSEQAVSRDNVAIVRKALNEYTELAPTDVREFVARFWDPDADYYPVPKFPEARPCHGRDEIARFQARFRDAWEHYDHVIKELIAVRDDRVLVHALVHAEGRESGVKLEGDLFLCFWLRHGRIFRAEDHLTRAAALHSLDLHADSLTTTEQ